MSPCRSLQAISNNKTIYHVDTMATIYDKMHVNVTV